MCEANAYLMRGDEEELFMESVDILRPEGETVSISGISSGSSAGLKRISKR